MLKVNENFVICEEISKQIIYISKCLKINYYSEKNFQYLFLVNKVEIFLKTYKFKNRKYLIVYLGL